jgi:integrase
MVTGWWYYAYKRGVTGSNPVAPTRFTQVEGLRESQAKEPRFRQEPNKEPNGYHRDVAESRPRRGHGEDSIYYDQANHYWVAAVSLGYKGGKRVRRKVTGRTKTEVRTKLRDLRRDLDHGVRSSATYTVGDALDDWLANGLNGRSDRTKELYRDTVKALRERLGEIKLRELTAGDVQEALDALAARLSTRSLQITRLCLERAIRHAEVRDLVGRNVAALIKAPAGRAGRPSKSLTLEQAQYLLRAAAGSWLYAYVVLSVTTGLRTEELRALRWSEVDLEAGTVAVYRAVRATADTKTLRSRRVLSLPRLAVQALHEHLDRQADDRLLAGALWQDHGLVFASAVGTPLDRHNVLREFRKITQAAGLGTGWVPREMRHTFVSLLSFNGTALEDIADLVGHRGTATTETVYRKVIVPELRRGAEVMDRLFG